MCVRRSASECPAILLGKCAVVISLPLQKLWKTSLPCGKTPSLLEIATVTSIYNVGSQV